MKFSVHVQGDRKLWSFDFERDANREQSREYQRRRRENGSGSVSVDGVPDELPDWLFERCTECDREFVRSEKAKGRCPMCRGIYNVKRESWTNEVMWRS